MSGSVDAGIGGPASRPSQDGASDGGGASVLDRALYALFSGHADRSRHDGDRATYRGTDVGTSFGIYVARLYGVSWIAFFVVLGLGSVLAAVVLPGRLGVLESALPAGGRGVAAVLVGLPAAVLAKYVSIRLGGRYLYWRAAARRSNIERTLPGAVRYLRVLSTGSDDLRGMLRKVADNREAYGHTAVSFQTALNKAALTGSLGEGLRIVARDTPSKNTLAPFLLKFREHASQGQEELTSYLRMEARMLSHRQSRARARRQDFLELLAELFIVMLVLPSLLVIVVSVLSVLSSGLGSTISTPVGPVALRAILIYGSALLVLVVGIGAVLAVESLRPPGQTRTYERPSGALATLASVSTNPASTVLLSAPLGLLAAGVLYGSGVRPIDVVLLSYATGAIPVGVVAVRRARIDDAKDRHIEDFVHAISGHVSLGRPFPDAVTRVAREVNLGPLDEDVADLAFNAGLTSREGGVRTAALEQFVGRVGTPLAEQTVGLVAGALEAGSDTDDVFEALQTEVGRLYHEQRALQSSMHAYVTVAWTTALLIVAITIAVDTYVLEGFTQLAAVADSGAAIAFDADGVDTDAMGGRFYVIAQATMLACGWFAGVASRGFYGALLHSGALVTIAAVLFAGVGLA